MDPTKQEPEQEALVGPQDSVPRAARSSYYMITEGTKIKAAKNDTCPLLDSVSHDQVVTMMAQWILCCHCLQPLSPPSRGAPTSYPVLRASAQHLPFLKVLAWVPQATMGSISTSPPFHLLSHLSPQGP